MGSATWESPVQDQGEVAEDSWSAMGRAWMLGINGEELPVDIHIYAKPRELYGNLWIACWMYVNMTKYPPGFLSKFQNTCLAVLQDELYDILFEDSMPDLTLEGWNDYYKFKLVKRLYPLVEKTAPKVWQIQMSYDVLVDTVLEQAIGKEVTLLQRSVDDDGDLRREDADWVIDMLNENFCRIRKGDVYQIVNTHQEHMYFRIGSKYTDWSNVIYMYVHNNPSIKSLTVDYDSTILGRKKPLVINMPRKDFLSGEYVPMLASKQDDGWEDITSLNSSAAMSTAWMLDIEGNEYSVHLHVLPEMGDMIYNTMSALWLRYESIYKDTKEVDEAMKYAVAYFMHQVDYDGNTPESTDDKNAYIDAWFHAIFNMMSEWGCLESLDESKAEAVLRPYVVEAASTVFENDFDLGVVPKLEEDCLDDLEIFMWDRFACVRMGDMYEVNVSSDSIHTAYIRMFRTGRQWENTIWNFVYRHGSIHDVVIVMRGHIREELTREEFLAADHLASSVKSAEWENVESLNASKEELMGDAFMLYTDGKAIPVDMHIIAEVGDLELNVSAAIWLYSNLKLASLGELFTKYSCMIASKYQDRIERAMQNGASADEEFARCCADYYSQLGELADMRPEQLGKFLREFTEGMTYEEMFSRGDSTQDSDGDFVARYIEENFVKVRIGSRYDPTTKTKQYNSIAYFRISSHGRNWTDTIYEFVHRNPRIKSVVVEREQADNWSSRENAPMVIMPEMEREEFLSAEKLPFLGSKLNDGWVNVVDLDCSTSVMGNAWLVTRDGQEIPVYMHTYGCDLKPIRNVDVALWVLNTVKNVPQKFKDSFMNARGAFVAWFASRRMTPCETWEEFSKTFITYMDRCSVVDKTEQIKSYMHDKASAELLLEGAAEYQDNVPALFEAGENVKSDMLDFVATFVDEYLMAVRQGNQYNVTYDATLGGDFYFRITSESFNWTDVIYEFVSNHGAVKTVTVSGLGTSLLDKMPRDEFLTGKIPTLSSKQQDEWEAVLSL